MSEVDLSKWGEVYEDQYHRKFLRLKDSSTNLGIQVKYCVPMEGTVEACVEETAPGGSPTGWYEVTVTGYAQPFEVHRNWVSIHGELRPGDIIEGLVNTLEHGHFWKLQKVPKEALGL